MEILTTANKNLKFIAGLLGLVQGLAWILLAAMCVALHSMDELTSIRNFKSYMGVVQFYMYSLFIKENSQFYLSKRILTPILFYIFCFVYIVFSLIWVVVSGNLMFRERNNISCSLKLWSCVTWVVCIWDMIVVVILGIDYETCMNAVNSDKISREFSCANGILPVLVIAARGFVLWFINFIFIFIIFRIQPLKTLPRLQPTYVPPHDNIPPNLQTHQNLAYNSDYGQNPPTSPVYANPDHLYQNVYTSPKPTAPESQNLNNPIASPTISPSQRKWYVYTSSTSPNRDAILPMHSTRQNWTSQEQIFSHQTQQPFVLKNPPRRR